MDNNLIQIKEYAKPKKDGGGSGGRITYNINGSDIGSSLKLKSLQANRILSDYIESNTVKAGTGDFVYLVASDGTISTLRGDTLDYSSGHIGELEADSIETDNLTVHETATIKNIFNEYLSSREIVTDYLTVNKAAHFFEVVIDKIRSVGGTIINTATNCVIDYVEPVIENGITTGYKCYWKQTNNEDDYVSNDWLPNDQAISQNCNLVAGVNHDTGTHYYWRLVKSTSNEDTQNGPMFVNFETGEAKHGTYDDEKQIYIAPEYEVTFVPFSGTDYIFKYDNGQDNEEGSFPVTVTDWNISGQTIDDEQEDDNWDEENNVLTVTDTLHGLQLIPNNVTQTINGVTQQKYPNIRRGHFTFNTSVNTKLNVMIMFDDDTIEYHPTNGPKTAYDIEIKNVNNAIVTMIVITSDVVDVWHACHWIVLGNETGEFDTPSNDYVINGSHVVNWDNIPAKGDNIAQLGYRYQNLDGYANTQAWKDAHKDEISRASAIIIAAYKTPDTGITPPSYAQYRKITDFNLTSHRHSYFDANNAEFVGNFKVTSGNDEMDLDQYIEQNSSTNYYRIICSEDPIVRPSSGTKNINVTVLNVVGGEATIMSESDLSGWYLVIDNDTDPQHHITVTPGTNHFTIGIANNASTIDIKLYDGNDALKDTLIASCIDLDAVTDGINGSWTQWVYCNYPIAGVQGVMSPPINNTLNSSLIPAGWSITQTAPLSTEYTWYSTRVISYDSNNNENPPGNFSTPARLTGANGKDGEDGGDIEFIYIRNNDNSAPTNPNTITQGQVGPQGIATNGTETNKQLNDWVPNGYSDRPMGVQSNLQYEFMSQRYKTNKTWGDFTTPSLWAKYAENGRDGDGVEYIFRLYGSATLPSAYYPNYATYAGKSFTDDDFVPQGWNDDPLSPTENENETYCFVSQRRQKNGEWSQSQTPWSTPAIWSRYSKDGDPGHQGPTGPQGIGGANAIAYKLIDNGCVVYSSIALDNNNDLTRRVYANLAFRIVKIDGNTVSYVSKDTENLTLSATFNNGPSFTFTGDSNNVYSATQTITPSSNADFANYNMITVTLRNSSLTTIDTVEIPVTMTSAATSQIIQGQQASIRNIVSGPQGISDIWQTMGGIQSTVTGIQSDYATTGYVNSQITQSADTIKSEVISEISEELPVPFIKTIDLTQLNNSYWYPVGITTEPNNTESQRIVIERPLLSEYGSPNYSADASNPNATNRGFSLICDWTTRWCGWGANWNPGSEEEPAIYYDSIATPYYARRNWLKGECDGYDIDSYRYINDYKPSWTRVVDGIPQDYIAGSIRHNYQTDEEFIYLRGGSKYDVKTGWNDTQVKVYVTSDEYNNVSASVRPDYWVVGYEDNESDHRGYQLKRIIDYNDLILPTKDTMKRSEIIQTADNIQLNVYNGLTATGINIDQHTITLNAATTTINGNLNLYDNNNNGITIYDANNIPRVNLQADPIGNISQMSDDTYTTISKYSTYDIGFNKTIKTDSFLVDANKVIDVSGITISAYGSSSGYATSNYATLKIDILDSDSEIVATKTVNIYRINEQGTYITSQALNCLTPSYGNYSVEFTITNMTGSYSGTAYVYAYAVIQTSSIVQTFIGQDGMYSHISSNKMYWINEDEIQMRMGFNGLRLINATDSARYGHINTICGVYGTQPNLKPVWIPFYNYTPMFNPVFKTTTETITNTGDTRKYVYRINPFNDYGICYITDAIVYDENHWILLPNGSTTYADINGTTTVNLPAGYTITIINYSHNTVYVSVDVSSSGTGIIRDFNGDNNRWCSLKTNSRYDTYIYTGYNNEWIALHDTQ